MPVLVKNVPDEAAAAMSLIENIQREDLNPLEEAQGLKRLTDEFGLTHEQAAQAVGRSRSAGEQPAAPAQPERAGAADADGRRSRHGPRARLLPLDGAQQILAAGDVVARKLSVREAEKLVQAAASAPAAAAARQGEVARRGAHRGRTAGCADRQGRDPHQKRTKRGEQGEVAIAFGSLEELNGLLDKLGLNAR